MYTHTHIHTSFQFRSYLASSLKQEYRKSGRWQESYPEMTHKVNLLEIGLFEFQFLCQPLQQDKVVYQKKNLKIVCVCVCVCE